MKTPITLTRKNSAAIAIDALPRLKLLAMASARLKQTEQPVKVGMTVTHKSYGAGKVVGEWGTIRSGVPCKDIFDVIFQNRSGRPFLHCCRKEYLTPDPLSLPFAFREGIQESSNKWHYYYHLLSLLTFYS